MDEIKIYRKQIDLIDGKILLMLKKRFAVVEKIGAAKSRLNVPVEDKKRIRELLRKRASLAAEYGLPGEMAGKIFGEIVAYSMDRQRKPGRRNRR